MSYPLYLYDILLYQLPTSIYQRALFHCLYPGRSAYLYMIYHVDISNYPSPYSREIPGTLNSGTPIPILLKYHSHKNSCMEMVWEASGKGLPLVPGEIPSIWVFPKIMVPPNHPFVHRVFHHNKPSILGVFTLFLETPIYIYIYKYISYISHIDILSNYPSPYSPCNAEATRSSDFALLERMHQATDLWHEG